MRSNLSSSLTKSVQFIIAICDYYRIKKSCQLLQFTDHSIAEISNLTCYSSPNHFERCFHQIMKISPSQYRKNNR
ncbi:hypothetical protein B1745_07045 [Lactobacillus amylolyticus]|uniref:helix-turn-helix domain-containing protein n=1 Tax=Lactobacillus amylolyticus TaxID=83683 RepID=UPI0009BB93BD|nr:hypothetical protein B1745_07045 [Lactobacillus amylolyticus]QFY05249.1 helix-turn-helix domain-containing protein [Lactobacillus amylolyticus]